MNLEPKVLNAPPRSRAPGEGSRASRSAFGVRRLAFDVSPKDAFTLLEILVAIGLLTMVVAAIYSSWNSILKGSRVALDAAAEAQRSRITMRTLHDSLICACMFDANASNYTFESTSDTDFSSLSFVARLPQSFPRSGKFGDLSTRRLQFTVENGTDNTRSLVLRQRPLIADFDKDEQQFPLVLARDVTKFLIEFTDPKTGDWVSEWDYTNQLPTEVRLTVGLGKIDQFSSHPQDAIVGIVAIPSLAVLQQYQVSGNGQIPNQNANAPGAQPAPGANPNPGGNNASIQPQ